MDITKYIPKNIVDKLRSKGLTEEYIISEIEKVVKTGKEMFPDNYEKYVRSRLKAKFNGLTSSEDVVHKAVVIGTRPVADENFRLKNQSKQKEGMKYKDPVSDKMIEVKEGYVPWGINIGKPIPDEPDWQQIMLVAFETKDNLAVKSITLRGDWVNNKELNSAESGDKILITGTPDMLDKKNINVSSYKVEGKVNDELFNTIIDKYLNKYKKTVRDVLDENFNNGELVVIKGDVSDFSPGNSVTKVSFTDETSEWGEENSVLSTYIQDPNFVEDAIDVTFVGEVFKKKNNMGFGFNTYMTLVPDEFKPVDTPKETEEIAEDNLADDVLDETSNDNIPKEQTSDEVDSLL